MAGPEIRIKFSGDHDSATSFPPMPNPTATLYYDFIDPLSYLVVRELDETAAEGRAAEELVDWHPFELRPPPTPLVTADDESLASRWSEARLWGEERGIVFAPPRLVPWTRKAHELVLHAGEHGAAHQIRRRLFEAYLMEGVDIGRVDVLVGLAVDLGLDRTETKAVLDVDRHLDGVVSLREEAGAAGVTVAPTLVFEGRRLEGFHNRDRIGTLLGT